MELAIVVGRVWATKKADQLSDYKLLQVELLSSKKGSRIIVADTLDAGKGDLVIVVGGSSARVGLGRRMLPVDAIVVGIADEEKRPNFL